MTLKEALDISRQGPFDGGYAKTVWLSQLDGKCLVLKGGHWGMGFVLYKRMQRLFPTQWHVGMHTFQFDAIDWEPVMPGDKILEQTKKLRRKLE